MLNLIEETRSYIEEYNMSETMLNPYLVLEKKEDTIDVSEVNSAAHKYELEIHQAIRKASKDPALKGIVTIAQKNPSRADTLSSFSPDVEFKFNGKRVPVEIKLNYKAQIGYLSFSHEIGTDEFTPITKYTEDAEDAVALVSEVLSQQKDKIAEFHELVKKYTPNKFKDSIPNRYSFTAPEVAIDKATAKMTLQFPTISVDPKVIAGHYNKKGVYYVQIGGSGLYYIGKDILNLGVPELIQETTIESRIKSGGSKMSGGISKKTVQLMATGRISKPKQSPYSLDDVNDIIELFTK